MLSVTRSSSAVRDSEITALPVSPNQQRPSENRQRVVTPSRNEMRNSITGSGYLMSAICSVAVGAVVGLTGTGLFVLSWGGLQEYVSDGIQAGVEGSVALDNLQIVGSVYTVDSAVTTTADVNLTTKIMPNLGPIPLSLVGGVFALSFAVGALVGFVVHRFHHADQKQDAIYRHLAHMLQDQDQGQAEVQQQTV